jgi:hypothetical protein
MALATRQLGTFQLVGGSAGAVVVGQTLPTFGHPLDPGLRTRVIEHITSAAVAQRTTSTTVVARVTSARVLARTTNARAGRVTSASVSEGIFPP